MIVVTEKLQKLDYFSWYQVGDVVELPDLPYAEAILNNQLPECKDPLSYVSAFQTALYFNVEEGLIKQIKEEIYWQIGENQVSFDAWFGVVRPDQSFFRTQGQISKLAPKIIQELDIPWSVQDMLKCGFRYIGGDVPRERYHDPTKSVDELIESGNLRLLKTQIDETYISTEYVYEAACRAGHLHVMKFFAELFKLDSVDISRYFDVVHGEEQTYEIIEWIVSKIPFDMLLTKVFLKYNSFWFGPKGNKHKARLQRVITYLESKNLIKYDENFPIAMAKLCNSNIRASSQFWHWLKQEGKLIFNKERWQNEVKDFEDFEVFFWF